VPASPQAADFGPRTALKVVDGVRDQIMGGKLKTGDAIRAELKVPLLPHPCLTCCACAEVNSMWKVKLCMLH
jgi:hypothetical protein